MKKLVSTIICSVALLGVFAFDGVINQKYTDAASGESSIFTWSIAGDQVKLEIEKEGEIITVIPQIEKNSIVIYGNKPDAEGKFHYMDVPLVEVETEVGNVKIIEEKSSNYNGETAQEITALTNAGMLKVQFLERIDVAIAKMKLFFADSKEFKAMSLVAEYGFPVSTMVISQTQAVVTLETISINETSVKESTFDIPAEYQLFTVEK